MSKLRSFLIKVCSLVLGVCATVGVLTMANASSVSAADPLFMIYDAGSIRLNVGTEGYSGLRFRGYVNTEWYASQGIESATFGTLVYPAKNGTVDTNKSSTENMNALDGDNVLWRHYNGSAFIDASIVFDDIVILKAIAEKYNTELGTSYTYESPEVTGKLATVKAELYAMDFTAYPYAIANGKTFWAENSYTTSMLKVAARTLVSIKDGNTEDENGTIKAAALSYVGSWDEKYYDGYASVVDKEVVVEGIENYQVSDDAIVVLDNENAIVQDGKITLAGEYTASSTPQKLYIFEEGSLKVVNLLLVDNVLKTAEDVKNFFDKSTWAEDATHYSEITILVNDVDMSTVEGDYGVTNSFSGYFDGRGHVISNLTKNKTSNANPIFGDLANSTVIKNIAFDNFTSIGYNVNNGWFAKELRGTVENIYVKVAPGSEMQQMIMYTRAGHLNNVIIEVPYDEELDVDAWVDANSATWGRTYLSRMVNVALTDNMNNVHVISQLPLLAYGEAATYKEPTFTDGTVSRWNSYFAYGENETDVWHDYTFFHTATDDATAPGLGLAEGAQKVENTQVLDANGYSLNQGVTRVWNGVKRYETLEEMVTANPDDVAQFVATGMWKYENGRFTWKNSANIVIDTVSGDYDASQNALVSTALNGEKVQKVTVNGVELSLENEEYTVDENGYLTSIYAKTSDSDTKNGISYKVNSADNTISDEVLVYTQNGIFEFDGVNYYTRIIGDAAELKLALDIDYTQNQGGTSGNGIVYNTHTDGVEYVFNAGIYKLNSNIDMADVTLDYTGMTLSYGESYAFQYNKSTSAIKGGFTGVFDGDGYVISNFKPTKLGMFAVLGTTGSGLTVGADIKNVAFVDVLTYLQSTSASTSTTSGYGYYSVIASHMYDSEAYVQNVSNIYVTYSSASTDMYGLVGQPTKNLKINDAYIVNEKGYNPISEDDYDMYYFADGTTLQPGKYYKNYFNAGTWYSLYKYANTSTLFANLFKMTAGNTTGYINNVYIASPNNLSYASNINQLNKSVGQVNFLTRTIDYGSIYKFDQFGPRANQPYECSGCGYYFSTQACTNGCVDSTFTQCSAAANTRWRRVFGYAGNETTGNYPMRQKLSPQLAAEIVEPIVTEDGTVHNVLKYFGKSKQHGYLCSTCYNNVSLVPGTTCTKNDCGGTMDVVTSGSNVECNSTDGIWGSPLAYTWVFPDLQSRSETSVCGSSNSIVRFMGVTKYDTIAELEQNVDFKASNFASNKYWKVTEDGKLYWASLYNAQA